MRASLDLRRGRAPARRFVVVVVALGILQPAASFADPRPTGPLAPSSGALLGAYVQTSSSSEAAERQAVDSVEQDLGRALDISVHPYTSDQSFPTWREAWDIQRGRIPMISWQGAASLRVVAGGEDDEIRARAEGLKALGRPVFLRWSPGEGSITGEIPSQVAGGVEVAAWRRIHELFAAEQATNVVWVWCDDAAAFAGGTTPTSYPGDDYVDWICADGYNWAPGTPGSAWQSFGDIFGDFHAWASTRSKPAMVGATGVQEGAANEKQAWIWGARNVMKNHFPKIQAFVYTNANDSFDWRYTTSTAARSAFKALATDPYFRSQLGALLGAWVQPQTGWSESDLKAAVTGLETDIGRRLDIDHVYYAFGLNFPGWREPWDLSQGRVPLISWGPTSTAAINTGSQDAYIRARADGIKALGQPVFLRWFYEMDTFTLADRAGSPAEYIAAWKRIRGIFASRGATNVAWVWCPTSRGYETGRAQTYYPGDTQVDWICADGYNWAPTQAGSTWRSFATIFTPFYSWASSRGKPLMIGETGVMERSAGEKAAWIGEMGAAVKTRPAIRALMYFDALAQDLGQGQFYDWRLRSSPASLAAFRALGTDPYFRLARGSAYPW